MFTLYSIELSTDGGTGRREEKKETSHLKWANNHTFRVHLKKSHIAFPCYTTVDFSHENLHEPKWQRSSCLRTHLANEHMKEIELKHRCLQKQFRSVETNAEILSVDPGKELGSLSLVSGCVLPSYWLLQSKHWVLLFFSPFFFCKSENPPWIFFQFVKTGTNVIH